jgi:hypothetical protein
MEGLLTGWTEGGFRATATRSHKLAVFLLEPARSRNTDGTTLLAVGRELEKRSVGVFHGPRPEAFSPRPGRATAACRGGSHSRRGERSLV